MTLNYSVIKNIKKSEHTRYHVLSAEGSQWFSVSSKEWNVKKQLEDAYKYDVCNDDRCFLCWSYGMSRIPKIELGEVLLITSGSGPFFDGLYIVINEFDPYDDNINDIGDLVRLGYIEKMNYIELWKDT